MGGNRRKRSIINRGKLEEKTYALSETLEEGLGRDLTSLKDGEKE
jgi:hypothetical protein